MVDISDCVGSGTLGGRTGGDKGGSIFAESADVNLYGGALTGNSGLKQGGAVHVYGKNSTFYLSGGTISDNSSMDGGAVYPNREPSMLTMSGGTISGNTATGSGGGINIPWEGFGTVRMYGGAIAGNKAAKGGVIFSSCGGTVNLYGGTITGNAATSGDGGVINISGGTITISGAKITGNTASQYGGAIYLYEGVTLTMTGGELSGNRAAKEGGAVHVYGKNSTFYLSGGTISDNSSVDGGAVYLNREPSVLTMSGGTISGNTASGNGGGVYIYRTGSVCNLSGGVIENNTAGDNGGGIYINSGNYGKLNLSGAPVVQGNTVSGKANNVYLPSGRTLTVGAMTDGAAIGVITEKVPAVDAPVFFGSANDSDFSAYFTSDREDYIPRHNAAKQLELAAVTYDVTYLPGADGTGEPVTDLKIKNTLLTLHGALFTRVGYVQSDWAAVDGGEMVYALDSIYENNAPLTLYPVWTAKGGYRVNFDANGGSPVEPKTGLCWTDTVLTAVIAPTREDWEFTGWRCGETAVTAQSTYGALAKDDTITSITLTAQWKDVTPPVIHGLADGNYWKKCSFCGHETQKQDIPQITLNVPAQLCPKTDLVFTFCLPAGCTLESTGYDTGMRGGEFAGQLTRNPDGGYTARLEWSNFDTEGHVTLSVSAITSDGYAFSRSSGEITVLAEHPRGGWTSNGNDTHSRVCALDASHIDTQGCSGGSAATCTKKSVCEHCGAEYGALDPQNHSGMTQWTRTETIHEERYTCCGEVTVAMAAHDWQDGVCTVCGYGCEHTGGTATCTALPVCKRCGMEHGEPDPQNHTELKHVAAKPATQKAAGNIEYWYCTGCGKYFRDGAVTEVITLEDTVITKLPKDPDHPKTGEETPLTFWLALLVVSGGLTLGLLYGKRRKQREE